MSKREKRVTRVTAALNSMNKKDIYSMLLFVLYKMKDIPEYVTLTELTYLLEGESITRFISYFGGMTLKVPTMSDLRLVVQGLYLYNYVEVEGGDFETGLKAIAGDEFSTEDLKNIYTKIAEVIANYEFKREA